MRIAGVLHESVVDGPGVRFVVFAQGCPHRCPGCHNPDTWDPDGGRELTVRELFREIRKAPPRVRGLTLSGGEPFAQAAPLAELAGRARGLGHTVVTYTGFIYEDLLAAARTDGAVAALLEATDILVDGPYIEAQKDVALRFRGSANQRLIDLAASRARGSTVLL